MEKIQAQAEQIYTERYFSYKIQEESIVICEYWGRETEVTIPASIAGYPVSVIASGAFIGSKVEKIYLPDTIMAIESNAIPLGTVVVYNSNIKKERVEVIVESVVNKTETHSVAPLTGSGKYQEGDMVTVTATAKVGYEFLGWYEKLEEGSDYTTNGKVRSTSYNYTFVAKNIQLVAVYESTDNLLLTITDATNITINGEKATEFTYKVAGTEIVLHYGTTEQEKSNFLYWKNASGKIVSTTSTYTFHLVNNTILTPVVKSAETGSALVEFLNEYNQVLSASTWTTTTTDDITTIVDYEMLETAPSKLGYTLEGWAVEGTDTTDISKTLKLEGLKIAVLAEIEKDKTYIRLVPVYSKDENIKKYVITYDKGNGYQQTEVEAGTRYVVTATAPPEGQVFKCWKSGDVVLSYSTSYTFLVTSDMTITAEYVDAVQTITKVPTLAMTSQYTVLNDANDIVEKVAFVVIRDISKDYTLLEHGILYAKDSDVLEAEFMEGTDEIKKFTATGTGAKGSLTVNIKVAGVTSNIKARAYAIIKDADGNISTIYSALSMYHMPLLSGEDGIDD